MPKRAPDFKLLDQDGTTRELTDYRGHWLVLYFYPKDDSLGCTKEACNFRDEYRITAQFGNAKIVGINRGSVTSHKKFSRHHNLNFPILSDPDHVVTRLYGAWGMNLRTKRLLDRPFRTRRNTYLINPDGYIIKKYVEVDPNDHASQVINDLQRLQADHGSHTIKKSATSA